MAEKKQDSGFTVTDRRLFTSEGELRSDVEEEKPAAESTAKASAVATPPSSEPAPSAVADPNVPPPPSAEEQKANADAYRKSSKDMDARVELSGHSAKELEMTFERFMASLYMSAMVQLGLMHEQGGTPHIDLIGARQTVDTIGMLAEKTKSNLTSKEKAFLDNALYELRMAYVEVTNALTRPPQAGPATGTTGR